MSTANLASDLGRSLEPAQANGRTIAKTFWGQSWCRNLQEYADMEYRLAGGRKVLRGERVLDLVVTAGRIDAFVQGEELFHVWIQSQPCEEDKLAEIFLLLRQEASSLIALMTGDLSESLLKKIADPSQGIFPFMSELKFSCECLDAASVCEHVAACLYGFGARLDQDPYLLFTLRGIDPKTILEEGKDVFKGCEQGFEDRELEKIFSISLY